MNVFINRLQSAVSHGTISASDAEMAATEYALHGAKAAVAALSKHAKTGSDPTSSVQSGAENANTPAVDMVDKIKLAEEKQDLADELLTSPSSERARKLILSVADAERMLQITGE